MQPHRDHDIAALADAQGGVVARHQLRELGVHPAAIDAWLQRGRLFPCHRGVYVVGRRRLGPRGDWWAALLACGDGAVLSHVTAAAVWGMRASAAHTVDVTVPPGSRRRSRQGIRVHRTQRLAAGDRAVRHGLAVTSVARTLIDVAATRPTRVVEQALDGAYVERLLDMKTINGLAPVGSARPGSTRLRAVLAKHPPGTTMTRTELEEAMLAICDTHGLPRPVANVPIAPWEADFLWAAERLVVEVDSFKFHWTPQRLARDRAKDADLMAAGYMVLRVADVHIEREPARVARSLQAVLAQRR